jgi:plasmid stabilization system protein ParE
MKYRVVVLFRAELDFDRCFDFIEQRSVEGAARWFAAFEACRDRLAESPLSHPLAPESGGVGLAIREVSFKTRRGKPYRIIYIIEGTEVRILRVRGPGQDFVSVDEL